MPARKKFRECGHINYGKTCPRCREADRVAEGYTTSGTRNKPIRIVPADMTEAARLRQPTNSSIKRRH
jgi:hypothetical protein